VDEVSTIVERFWPGERAAVERLGGGITNHNFKVTVGDEAFVLRLAGKDTALLGIDRSHEHDATRVAASLGIGPEVVSFTEGCLITRFIDGRPVPRDELDPAAVGSTIRTIHDGPAIPGRFDSFRVVETYRDTAAAHGVRIPPAYEQAARRAAETEARRIDVRLCPCHNDLLNANFLDDGERLRIVDWEYAGMGDPFFDLGNFAANHELDEVGERLLLAAYGECENENDSQIETLHDMRFMSNFREAMWGVVQQGISELDFDFAAYADDHFARALA